MRHLLYTALLAACATCVAWPTLAQSTNPQSAPDRLHMVAMGQSGAPLCDIDAIQAQEAPAVIQIMCLAALADGKIGFAEAHQIALERRALRLRFDPAAYIGAPNDGAVDQVAARQMVQAARSVISASEGITNNEAAFLTTLAASLGYGQEDLRDLVRDIH